MKVKNIKTCRGIMATNNNRTRKIEVSGKMNPTRRIARACGLATCTLNVEATVIARALEQVSIRLREN